MTCPSSFNIALCGNTLKLLGYLAARDKMPIGDVVNSALKVYLIAGFNGDPSDHFKGVTEEMAIAALKDDEDLFVCHLGSERVIDSDPESWRSGIDNPLDAPVCTCRAFDDQDLDRIIKRRCFGWVHPLEIS